MTFSPGEGELRQLFENAPLGMFQSTPEGRFVFVNSALVEILGYSCIAEVLALDLAREVYVDPVEREQSLALLAKSGVLKGVEVAWKRRDGTCRMIRIDCYAALDAHGNALHYAGTVLDVTDHRAVQVSLEKRTAELAQRESELRLVLAQLPGMVWTTDTKLAFTSSQGAALRSLGLSPGQLVGVTLPQYFGTSDPSFPPLAHHMTALGGQAVSYSTDWESLSFVSQVVPLRGPDESIIGTLGCAIDVTEQRRLERKLQQAQKLESLGLLAGGVAHDFNNLLAAMLGSAELALRVAHDSPRLESLIRQFRLGAVRAAGLTRQLLDYSGKGYLAAEPLDLSELVEETAALLHPRLAERAELHLDLDPTLPAIEGDAAQIRQIVMNLLTNAAEAIDGERGNIVIRTYACELGAAQLQNSELETPPPPGTYGCLEVSDDGCGMDGETRRRLFEPFFTTKQHGHGLGLATAMGIMSAHGGLIEVHSGKARGSKFRLLFPLGSSRVSQGGGTRVKGEASMKGTVLVVDDDDMVRDVALQMVEELGYVALPAADGHAALACMGESAAQVGVVLLDMTMPGMGGAEVFERIHERWPNTQIILSSGYDEQQHVSNLVARGEAFFLQKPYHFEALEEVLAAAMRRARPSPDS